MSNGRSTSEWSPSRGAGGGPGRGRGGARICLCPNCSHEEPHERGVPCAEKSCPECGTRMMGKR